MQKLVEQILNSPVPTRLITGSLEQIQEITECVLQSKFCLQKPDISAQPACFCNECRKIKNRQHPFMLWLSPEKDYSVDDMDAIFDKTRFALDDGHEFFFVLDKAHALNSASANKILKILEEPPIGYNFILLTDNKNLILPTILSRSFLIQAGPNIEQALSHQLLKYFAQPNALPEATIFDQELKKLQLSDSQSAELCQTLLEYFIKKTSELYAKSTTSEEIEKSYFYSGMKIAQKRLKTPPASGSSNMFWKLLYLDFSML